MTTFVSWINDIELIPYLLNDNENGEHNHTILRLLEDGTETMETEGD